jgi:hypothetical protein
MSRTFTPRETCSRLVEGLAIDPVGLEYEVTKAALAPFNALIHEGELMVPLAEPRISK